MTSRATLAVATALAVLALAPRAHAAPPDPDPSRAPVVVSGDTAISAVEGFVFAAPEGWRAVPLLPPQRAIGLAARFRSGDAVAALGKMSARTGNALVGAVREDTLPGVGEAVGCDRPRISIEKWELASGNWDVRAQRCKNMDGIVGFAAAGYAPRDALALLVIVASRSEPLDAAAWKDALGAVRWGVSESREAQLAHERAEALAEDGDAAGALAAWESALEADPDFWPAAAGRARALLALGRIDAARAAFEAVLGLEPRDFLSHADFLRLGLATDDADLVERLALDALARAPGARALQRGVARVLWSAERAEALARLAPLLLVASVSEDSDPHLHLALMTAFEHVDDPERALFSACRAERIAADAMRGGDRTAARARVAALRGIRRLVGPAKIEVEETEVGQACETLRDRIAARQPAPAERPTIRPAAAPSGATVRRVDLGEGHELLLPLPGGWRLERVARDGHDLAGAEIHLSRDVVVYLTAHRLRERETVDELRRLVDQESGFFKGAFGGTTEIHDLAGPEVAGRVFRLTRGGGERVTLGGELAIGPLRLAVTVVVDGDDVDALDEILAALAHARHESASDEPRGS